jgi:uncharacterized coiled-coil protein SlyX
MKNKPGLLIGASLSVMLLTSTSEAAAPAPVPSLDTRVRTLEVAVPQLDNRVDDLEVTVEEQGVAGADLSGQVESLQTTMTSVQNELLTLQNKLLFAVVDADGTIRASRGVQSAAQSVDGSGNPIPGHYDVIFSRNVTACAVTVTAEPSSSSGIIASINGTFRGDAIHNPNRFIVVLSDHDNDRVNWRFNIMVMC